VVKFRVFGRQHAPPGLILEIGKHYQTYAMCSSKSRVRLSSALRASTRHS
jgi:hypothetical protein